MGGAKRSKASSPKLVVRFSAFSHPKSVLLDSIKAHPFNSAIELVLPAKASTTAGLNQEGVEDASASECEDWSWFSVQAPVHFFLEKSFLATYIRGPGDLVVLSHRNAIDSADVVAISPHGRLHLAVTKDTYEQLGLVGKSSQFLPGQRFNIEIDLRHRSFLPGRKLHDRVQECLRERTQPLELLCAYSVDGRPQDIVFPGGITAQRHISRRSVRRLHSLPLPPIEARQVSVPAGEGWGGEESVAGDRACVPLDAEFLEALYEWLGTIACGVSGIEAGSGPPASEARHPPRAYDWPVPWRGEAIIGEAEVVRWSGLIVPAQVLSYLQSARERVRRREVPWAALNVWGFADSPVSWDGAEHGYLVGGENDYSVVLLPDDSYLLFRAAGSHDDMR